MVLLPGVFQFDVEQGSRQGRCPDWRAGESLDDVGDGAGVVFVAVGVEDAVQPEVFLFPQIAEVRDDVIDAQHVVLGEHDAAVNQEGIVAPLDHRHVLADFAEAAQGDDSQALILHDSMHQAQRPVRTFLFFSGREEKEISSAASIPRPD